MKTLLKILLHLRKKAKSTLNCTQGNIYSNWVVIWTAAIGRAVICTTALTTQEAVDQMSSPFFLRVTCSWMGEHANGTKITSTHPCALHLLVEGDFCTHSHAHHLPNPEKNEGLLIFSRCLVTIVSCNNISWWLLLVTILKAKYFSPNCSCMPVNKVQSDCVLLRIWH